MSPEQPVALVTGARQGIGFETCRVLARRGFLVVLTARGVDQAREAAAVLRAGGLAVEGEVLDVCSERDAVRLAAWVERRFGRLDALVNNAGVFPRGDDAALAAEPEAIRAAFEVNCLGALRTTQAFAPLLRKSRGAVVNVSSGMGQISEMKGGQAAYRLSKAALNAVTRVLAAELDADGVRVNAVCPGWVRTAMGGPDAPRSVEQGAEGVVWAACLPAGGPTGGFFRDGGRLEW